jgi:DNA-binding CsgD family transcriptional regulator
MAESWRLILLLIPLLAGAIAIFFAFQLMKRYGTPFANSYFYYLVFLYIFGSYSLAGSGILEHLLGRMEVELKVIHSTRLYTIFLGIPFLVLSKFMLLRSSAEFFAKKVSRLFTLPYFIVCLIVFVLYGVFTVRLTYFDQGDYQVLIHMQHWVFFGFMIAMYLIIYFSILRHSRAMTDRYEKRFIRILGLLYLLYMVAGMAAFALRDLHVMVEHLFFFLFLSWHLVPLLFLNLYLEKYHGQTAAVQDDFESQLQAFAAAYEISKREKEVIQLISKGLSNQEISDSLYISLQTVKDHIHRIFVKTGVKNRVQLTNMIRSGKSES